MPGKIVPFRVTLSPILYPEIMLTPAQKDAFIRDRKGFIAGRKLAERFGLNPKQCGFKSRRGHVAVVGCQIGESVL
ncbi:MAG: hypothetical protein HGA78_00335 [Nitrospirales bacterium]|nr:hypothetical protein [Nitrospirales bacterium]